MALSNAEKQRNHRDKKRGYVTEVLGYVTEIQATQLEIKDELAWLRNQWLWLRNFMASDSSLLLPSSSESTETKEVREREVREKEPATKRRANGQVRGTRLAPDWQPSAEGYQFALDAGIDPDATFDSFRDYWLAKTERATKLDWEATWRIWCRREQQRARNGHDKLSPVAKLYQGAYRAVCAREARRRADLADDEPFLDC